MKRKKHVKNLFTKVLAAVFLFVTVLTPITVMPVTNAENSPLVSVTDLDPTVFSAPLGLNDYAESQKTLGYEAFAGNYAPGGQTLIPVMNGRGDWPTAILNEYPANTICLFQNVFRVAGQSPSAIDTYLTHTSYKGEPCDIIGLENWFAGENYLIFWFTGTGIDVLVPKQIYKQKYGWNEFNPFTRYCFQIYDTSYPNYAGDPGAACVREVYTSDPYGDGDELASVLRIDDLPQGTYSVVVKMAQNLSFYGAIKVLDNVNDPMNSGLVTYSKNPVQVPVSLDTGVGGNLYNTINDWKPNGSTIMPIISNGKWKNETDNRKIPEMPVGILSKAKNTLVANRESLFYSRGNSLLMTSEYKEQEFDIMGLSSQDNGSRLLMWFEGTGLDILVPKNIDPASMPDNWYGNIGNSIFPYEIYCVDGNDYIEDVPSYSGNTIDRYDDMSETNELVSAFQIDDLPYGKYVLSIGIEGDQVFYGAVEVLGMNEPVPALGISNLQAMIDAAVIARYPAGTEGKTPSSIIAYKAAYDQAISDAQYFVDEAASVTPSEGDIEQAILDFQTDLAASADLLKTIADKSALESARDGALANKKDPIDYDPISYALYVSAFDTAISKAQGIINNNEIYDPQDVINAVNALWDEIYGEDGAESLLEFKTVLDVSELIHEIESITFLPRFNEGVYFTQASHASYLSSLAAAIAKAQKIVDKVEPPEEPTGSTEPTEPTEATGEGDEEELRQSDIDNAVIALRNDVNTAEAKLKTYSEALEAKIAELPKILYKDQYTADSYTLYSNAYDDAVGTARTAIGDATVDADLSTIETGMSDGVGYAKSLLRYKTVPLKNGVQVPLEFVDYAEQINGRWDISLIEWPFDGPFDKMPENIINMPVSGYNSGLYDQACITGLINGTFAANEFVLNTKRVEIGWEYKPLMTKALYKGTEFYIAGLAAQRANVGNVNMYMKFNGTGIKVLLPDKADNEGSQINYADSSFDIEIYSVAEIQNNDGAISGLSPVDFGTASVSSVYDSQKEGTGEMQMALTIDGLTPGDYIVKINLKSDSYVNGIVYPFYGVVEVLNAGDVNKDGIVNSVDMLLIQGYTKGIITLTEEEFEAADINGDGIVNSTDMVLLQNRIKSNPPD